MDTVVHSHRRLPVAALCAVAVVLLIEVVILPAVPQYYFDSYMLMLLDKRQAMKEVDADVAIFGSSRAHHIDPEIVSASLPGDPVVRNYTWGWCGAEAYYGMLHLLISTGNVPKMVIVDGWPELFAYPEVAVSVVDNPNFLLGFSQTLPAYHGVFTLLRHHLPKEAWDLACMYATPPTARYRNWIDNQVDDFLKNGKWDYPPAHYDDVVLHSRKHGWFLAVPAEQVAPDQAFTDLHKVFAPMKVQNNKRVLKAYERFLRLAEDHDIQVVMAGLPSNPLFYDIFTKNGTFEAYDQWLNKMEERYPHFSAPQPRYYTAEGILGDAWHVNAVGAEMHMKLLSQALENMAPKHPTPAADQAN